MLAPVPGPPWWPAGAILVPDHGRHTESISAAEKRLMGGRREVNLDDPTAIVHRAWPVGLSRFPYRADDNRATRVAALNPAQKSLTDDHHRRRKR